jgi:superfamily II DNA or RNA helicase
MSHLVISKKNEVYLQIEAEPHIYYELRDAFQFEVPNAKFSPAYKNKWWDGIIYMFNVNTREIYVGLLDRVIQFCKDHQYTYEFKSNKYYGLPFEQNEEISKEGVKDYVTSISKYAPRDYQIDGIYQALRNNRKVILSPTSSGKSLMIYSLVRYYAAKKNRILIIVPTTSLVSQLYKDFIDYGWDAENHCHMIYSGQEKDNDKEVYISTWQSLFKLPKKYFEKFQCVMV